jgi:hypothetical protein
MSQPLDLDAIRSRAQKATEGTWVTAPMHGSKALGVFARSGMVAGLGEGDQALEDAFFIAHAREDVPALIAALTDAWAEVERLRAENERLRPSRCQASEGPSTWSQCLLKQGHSGRHDFVRAAVSHTEETPT